MKFLVSCLLVLLCFFPQLVSAKSEEISIYSSNLNFFPDHILKGRLKIKERAQKIARAILSMKPLPDVITFQELWTRRGRKAMTKALEKEYPYHRADRRLGRFLLGVNSGLAVYSKYPILDSVLESYKNYRGDERFAYKSIMGVKLLVHEKELFVFTTHMQAGLGVMYEWLAKRWWGRVLNDLFEGRKPSISATGELQLAQASQVIHKFTKDKKAPILFVGDFNIASDAPEYSHLEKHLKSLHMRDTYCPGQSRITGTLPEEGESSNRRIDYQLNLGEMIAGCSTILDNLISPSVLTDHFATYGRFVLN